MFELIAGALSVGLTAYGAISGAKSSSDTASQLNPLYQQQAAASQDVAAHEQKINALHQQYMELTNRRQELQNVRSAQVARSHAEAAASGQGAIYGSGLQGGLAQVSGEERTNALGLSQGLEIGQGIFAQNTAISADKMTLAGIGGQINQIEASAKSAQSTAAGYSSLGSSLMAALPTIGRFTQTYNPNRPT